MTAYALNFVCIIFGRCKAAEDMLDRAVTLPGLSRLLQSSELLEVGAGNCPCNYFPTSIVKRHVLDRMVC